MFESHRIRGACNFSLALVAAVAWSGGAHAAEPATGGLVLGEGERVAVVDMCAGADTATPRKRCMGKRATHIIRADGTPRALPDSTPSGFGATDLQSAYAMPAASGTGPTVGVLEAFHYSGLEVDLATYRAQYSLPACTSASGCLTEVYVDNSGQTTTVPTADSGWEGQTMLAVDMVSAMCPQCKILVVEADTDQDNALFLSPGVAAQLGVVSMTVQFGALEQSTDTANEAYFNQPGVLITAPAGDSGYGAVYPAASAYVLAVGGTHLTQGGTGRGWTETVWNYSGSGQNATGTGSGCSPFITKPSWQGDPSCLRRMETDVSAVADPNTGVAMFDRTWTVAGSTSISAAIVAAAFAALGVAPQGPALPWNHPTAFYDVTSGTNAPSGGCTADPYYCVASIGYDGPSGWGTPNGAAIALLATDAGAPPIDGGTESGAGEDSGTVADSGAKADSGFVADSGSSGGSDSGSPMEDASVPGSDASLAEAGEGGATAAPGSGSSGGCGCHVGPAEMAPDGLAIGGAALALAALARARRRR